MKAVQKHGTNYKLIALAVRTRTRQQIRHRLSNLLEQMKENKHHPDRLILRPYEKQRIVGGKDWTRKETEVLVKAVKKHRKNYQMIANALKNRTVTQVKTKMYGMLRSIESNPNHELAAKLRLSISEQHVWTEKEDAKFIKVLKNHGKDKKKLI